MSLLLTDDDDDICFEDVPVISGGGGELPFEGNSRGKSKKTEKKLKSDDKKNSSKSLSSSSHWAKQRDNVVQEKTPRRFKGQTKSTSKTPPDSPKISRGSELRGGKGAVKGPQLQPSPNVKNQRKRYSQFLAESSSSSEEGEGLKRNEGFLLSNQTALKDEVGGATNDKFINQQQPFTSHFHPETVDFEAQKAWIPTTTTTSTTTTFGGNMLFSETSSFLSPTTTSPSKHVLPSIRGGTVNPLTLTGELRGDEGSLLVHNTSDFIETNPFLSSVNISIQTSYPIPAPPSSPPSPPPPPQITTSTPRVPPPEDWSLSDELKTKCSQRFNELHPINGLLQGDKARKFFIQSKLPNHELSAIWRVADRDQDNALSQEEFCIAMKLVLMRRKGYDIPTRLPDIMLTEQNIWSTRTSPPLPAVSSSHDPDHTFTTEGPSPIYDSLSDNQEVLVHLDDEVIGGRDTSSPHGGGRGTSSPHGGGRGTSSPHGGGRGTSSPQPRVGRIISLEDEEEGVALEACDDEDQSVALVKTLSDSDSDEIQVKKDFKPVRPAPPKPRPFKSKPHPSSSNTSSLEGGVVSDDIISPTTHSDVVPMLITNKGLPPTNPPRPTGFAPPKKSAYSTLVTSPSTTESPDQDVSDETTDSGFRWKHLGDLGPSSSAPTDGTNDKAHSRSTSVDLNKMLLGPGEVFGDLPSAIPPKPPPKLKAGSPPSVPLLGVEEAGEGWEIISNPPQRPRALSTGSMASVGGGVTAGTLGSGAMDDIHISSHMMDHMIDHMMDTSSDALLKPKTPPPKAPKPKKIPMLPPVSKGSKPAKPGTEDRRDSDSSCSGGVTGTGNKQVVALGRPPPAKSNALAELYQGGGVEHEVKGHSKCERSGSIMKDKSELQISIRSLKENNEALVDINKNLEQKLFQLMEERVKLARELTLLSGQS